MAEKVFLIHGWSVQETTTYQALHERLSQYGFTLHEIFLGRYVSIDNEVEVKDIAKAMHNELVRHLGKPPWKGPIHMVTHSTGALVVKHWIVQNYVKKFTEGKPLKNLVFLAGPHFGSRLAHHGYSMLSYVAYLGPTGKKILAALELGSEFSWVNNEKWLDMSNWKAKGIRPYCLIGDKVSKDFFKSKIFPAGYEEGSDMVVRVPAGNLNFCRYELNGITKKVKKTGEIKGVPFAALANYIHTGEEEGIMNSITTAANPAQAKYLNLKLILQCLKVRNEEEYHTAKNDLANITKQTRRKRKAFAQIDFRFKDETGAPIDDYRIILGYLSNSREKPSKMVSNTHKNIITSNHFTVFLDYSLFDPKLTYFMDFNANTGTSLYTYKPDPYKVRFTGQNLTDIIRPNQTTQIDITLGREPHHNLFVFHRGDDPELHVKWNRDGEIVKEKLPMK